MKKTTPDTPEAKAYARGYRAGKKSERHSANTVIKALNEQARYWRKRYVALRCEVSPNAEQNLTEALR